MCSIKAGPGREEPARCAEPRGRFIGSCVNADTYGSATVAGLVYYHCEEVGRDGIPPNGRRTLLDRHECEPPSSAPWPWPSARSAAPTSCPSAENLSLAIPTWSGFANRLTGHAQYVESVLRRGGAAAGGAAAGVRARGAAPSDARWCHAKLARSVGSARDHDRGRSTFRSSCIRCELSQREYRSIP